MALRRHMLAQRGSRRGIDGAIGDCGTDDRLGIDEWASTIAAGHAERHAAARSARTGPREASSTELRLLTNAPLIDHRSEIREEVSIGALHRADCGPNGLVLRGDVLLGGRLVKDVATRAEMADGAGCERSVGRAAADVGGLETLKEWIRLRQRAFGQEAREYGLPAPKGIALIGIPGTGKSLTAKAIGGMWRLPLIRLDIGAVFGSLVGESEERIRKALRLTEQIAPCVLWIDELEKALASGGGDGGTSQRVVGTILTWMQDKKAPVFVVATANDISSLPPELLRRGRFDEVFFLDLPTFDERTEIITVHLRKRGRNPNDFDLTALANQSALYVGAEIEQALIDAMYASFNEEREVTTEDFSRALRSLVPLSRSQREQIDNLRLWLTEGRAQSASFTEREAAVASTRNLNVVALDLPRT